MKPVLSALEALAEEITEVKQITNTRKKYSVHAEVIKPVQLSWDNRKQSICSKKKDCVKDEKPPCNAQRRNSAVKPSVYSARRKSSTIMPSGDGKRKHSTVTPPTDGKRKASTITFCDTIRKKSPVESCKDSEPNNVDKVIKYTKAAKETKHDGQTKDSNISTTDVSVCEEDEERRPQPNNTNTSTVRFNEQSSDVNSQFEVDSPTENTCHFDTSSCLDGGTSCANAASRASIFEMTPAPLDEAPPAPRSAWEALDHEIKSIYCDSMHFKKKPSTDKGSEIFKKVMSELRPPETDDDTDTQLPQIKHTKNKGQRRHTTFHGDRRAGKRITRAELKPRGSVAYCRTNNTEPEMQVERPRKLSDVVRDLL